MPRLTHNEWRSLVESHFQWLSDSTTGGRLVLQGYDLTGHLLAGDLRRAVIRESRLDSTTCASGVFSDADFSSSTFVGANLYLANLCRANMSGTDLRGANLGHARFTDALVACAVYEGITDAPHVDSMALAVGLDQLQYVTSPASMVALREGFAERGFRQQERDIIAATRKHDENYLEYILFHLTCNYGADLLRPWLPLGFIWLVCTAIYWTMMVWGSQSGIVFLIRRSSIAKSREQNEVLKSDMIDSMVRVELRPDNAFDLSPSENARKRIPMRIRLVWWALFFSSISAFNIGFRDINFGRWLKLLTRRKFDLEPFGWTRVVSGVQALISVYLLALWILSLYATPFK
ncbi:MAG: pentapeptide repeat-containing protein [candidate division Zixibacteria bacterium]|nr:pentapeptide repeat-containing protein [candidate division Zixibacteria bacterium]